MKKYILIPIMIAFIFPSVAFAAWWNPFTWKFFQKTETKTEILENRIKELENKLNVATTSPQLTTTKNSVLPVKPIIPKEKNAIKTSAVNSENTDKEYLDSLCKRVSGINSKWNGTLSNTAGVNICDCNSGYQKNNENLCISTPSVPAPDGWLTPEGKLKTADEIINYNYAKCASQNLVWNRTSTDNIPNCITHDQSCDNKIKNSVFIKKVDDRTDLCNCKTGYEWNSGRTVCQIQTQDTYNPDPYGVSSGAGTAYSPEQLNAIDCAYYGTNCTKTNSVQINNYYQAPQSAPQAQTVNCSNYQIEKANLLQSASDRGVLFSGVEAQKQSALKAKYPGCN